MNTLTIRNVELYNKNKRLEKKLGIAERMLKRISFFGHKESKENIIDDARWTLGQMIKQDKTKL